jgi:NADPH:quinone reductase-like Zn-dependent oxidoreductase
LFSLGRLEATDTVLIHAAAGGVGAAAVQLAKLTGARVVASVGSPAKVEWVQALGADAVLNYREVDFAGVCHEQTDGRGVDVILDFIGASAASRHQRCLAEAGRWVMIGLLGGTRAELDLGVFVRRRLQLLGLVMRTRTLAEKSAIVERFRARGLEHLRAGTLRPTVDRVYPLEQVAAAHERMERNENLGKIVLSIAS